MFEDAIVLASVISRSDLPLFQATAIPCEAIGDSANEAKNSYFNIFCLFQKCLHLLFQCNILISEIF
jgi:hypothetical protein